MAGLFGFLLRAPRDPTWAERRLLAMERATSRGPGHVAIMHRTPSIWVGQSGPGILPGSLTVHPAPGDGFLLAEGECYHEAERCERGESPTGPWTWVARRWTSHGSPALRGLDGLFTLVLGDGAAPRLRIANDRYGSRRLYVLDTPDAFAFASELRPLLTWPEAGTIDAAFLRQVVCLGAPLDGRTWVTGIRLMPPATEYEVTPAGVRTTRYWSWDDLPQPSDGPAAATLSADQAGRLQEAWDRALTARLPGERVGQLLSGGLDSRVILADGASRRRGDWVAVTYGEPDSDEVRFAREAAAASGVPWVCWSLPEPDWLDARTRYCLANDGVVDIVNAFHATLRDRLGSLMRWDISGYLGDLVLGATYEVTTAEEAMRALPYWHSPIALPEAEVRATIEAGIGAAGARGWLIETKCRRATNAWAHSAVNVLEVRKPFMDYRLVELAATLPLRAREARACHRVLLSSHPALARVPWQKTGVALDASPVTRWAMRARRLAYRMGRHGLRPLGVVRRPWVRGAVDLQAWLSAPHVAETLHDTLRGRSARITAYFDPRAVADILEATLTRQSVAHEPLLHLYLVERMLGEIPLPSAEVRQLS